ncbi:unnamed protein product [Closterium sp. NIES-53]
MFRSAKRVLLPAARAAAGVARIHGSAAASAESASLAEAYKRVAPQLDVPSTPLTYLKERPAVSAAIPEKLTLNLSLPHAMPYSAKEVSYERVSPDALRLVLKRDRSSDIPSTTSGVAGTTQTSFSFLLLVLPPNKLINRPPAPVCFPLHFPFPLPLFPSPFLFSLPRFLFPRLPSFRSHFPFFLPCSSFHLPRFPISPPPSPSPSVDSVIIPATSGQMGVLPGHVASIAELKPGLLTVIEGTTETKLFVSSGFAFVHPNSVLDVAAVDAVPLDQIDGEEVKKGLAAAHAKVASASTDLEKAEAQISVDVHSALSAALGL